MVRTSPDRNDSSQSRSLSASELFQSPRRQVNPYGTVPVLGTTYYVVSWFGVIVEWCGLEWAAKVLDLCDLRDDPILRSAAAGVTRSGLQQMFDREPWIGLYPDVWNVEGNWAGGALICPRLLVNALRAGGHLPQALKRWTRRVELGSNALIVNGWGELLSCRGNGQKLEIALRFLEKERGEILVAQSPEPRSIHGNEKELKADDGAQDGFRYDPARKLLGARFLSGSKDVTISVLFR